MEDGGFTDIDQANALADTVLSAVRQIVDGAFWKLLPEDQLNFGRRLEVIARTVYAAQVHQAGEIDTQGLAADRSCTSTAALLRQALVISQADAKARVAAAKQILPRLMPTGAEAPPILPELAQAVDCGAVGPEHIKIIVETMAKVPPKARPEARDLCEATLVDTAIDCDPNYLGHAAQRILDKVDPDGDLDDTTPASKMELHFGTRSTRTGLTPIKGQLDDYGVEVVKKAIDGLAAPRPEQDGVRDPRPAATRAAQALVEALRRFLDLGAAPMQGGERPHITITMNWDAITGMISGASYDTGAMISPAQARKYLCDAQIIPMILGSKSEVLDVGRASRTFPAHIRRALVARDRGCAWPGCDRPPDWCDGHTTSTSGNRDFGPTCLDNGCLLQARHLPPHRDPPRRMGHPDDRRRPTRVHPAKMDRPATETPTEHTAKVRPGLMAEPCPQRVGRSASAGHGVTRF